MNELELLRKRLLVLDKLWNGYSDWQFEHWQEVWNIMEVLDLLDPCWEEELDKQHSSDERFHIWMHRPQ